MKLASTRIVFLILSAFSLVASAQDVKTDAAAVGDKVLKSAIAIDEFGRVGDCDAGARIDNFFIQLNDNPGAVGYVIFYPGVDMLPSEAETPPHMRQIRRAIEFRRYDTSRVVFVNGGYRSTGTTELFLVPAGATPPQPTNTIRAPKAPRGTFLWSRSGMSSEDYGLSDEFVLDSVKKKEAEAARLQEIEDAKSAEGADDDGEVIENVPEEVVEEEALDPLEQEALRFGWFDQRIFGQIEQRKDSRGTIIFYADDERYDIGKLKQFIVEARNRFAKETNVNPDSITVKFGGYRSYDQAEYWIVPKGGKAPQPTPEERPVEEEDEPSS